MKFKFPLQNVLSYRKTVENVAQKDFQEAVAELNKNKQILSDMKELVAIARESAYAKQVGGGAMSSALVQVDEFIKGQDIRISRQQSKIQECENRVEELREILRLKAIDYKIIERLKERKKQEFNHDESKLDQKRTDEMNVMRFKSEKGTE
jgi:flagellar FliJ protein